MYRQTHNNIGMFLFHETYLKTHEQQSSLFSILKMCEISQVVVECFQKWFKSYPVCSKVPSRRHHGTVRPYVVFSKNLSSFTITCGETRHIETPSWMHEYTSCIGSYQAAVAVCRFLVFVISAASERLVRELFVQVPYKIGKSPSQPKEKDRNILSDFV